MYTTIHPNGGLSPCEPNLYGIQTAVGGIIDLVKYGDEDASIGMFVHDEGLLRDYPLNLPVFMATGCMLAGNVVLVAADPDPDGETLPCDHDNELFMRICGIAVMLAEAEIRMAQLKRSLGAASVKPWRRWTNEEDQ